MQLNTKIRMVCEPKQWSQKAMADKMGVSKNGYTKIAQQRGKLPAKTDKLQMAVAHFKKKKFFLHNKQTSSDKY